MGVRKLGEDYDEDDLIARVNAVCAEVDTSVDAELKEYQRNRVGRNEW